MNYAIAITAGIVGGILLPLERRGAYLLFAAGAVIFVIVSILAFWAYDDSSSILNVLLLKPSVSDDRFGLIQLTGAGYTFVVAGIIIGIRLLWIYLHSKL